MSTKEKSSEEATDEDGDNSIVSPPTKRPVTLKRKVGHAPNPTICDVESGGGAEESKIENVSPSAASGNSANSACITPARSVPDMDTDQASHVPYQPLDTSKRLPGQLSSQTASMASEGSQVGTELSLLCKANMSLLTLHNAHCDKSSQLRPRRVKIGLFRATFFDSIDQFFGSLLL